MSGLNESARDNLCQCRAAFFVMAQAHDLAGQTLYFFNTNAAYSVIKFDHQPCNRKRFKFPFPE